LPKSLQKEQVSVTGDSLSQSFDGTYHTKRDCKQLDQLRTAGKYFARVTLWEARRMGRFRECADCYVHDE